MPWNMQDLLASAELAKRSKILERPMSPADARMRHLGFEDYLKETGKLDRTRGIYPSPEEFNRIRCFFIPKLRGANFCERPYNPDNEE